MKKEGGRLTRASDGKPKTKKELIAYLERKRKKPLTYRRGLALFFVADLHVITMPKRRLSAAWA